MKYLKIPEGSTSLMLAFSGDVSKLDDEQRGVWKRLDEAAKSALAQQLDKEKTMETPEICEVEVEKDDIDPGIQRAHEQGGPDGAGFDEACAAMVGEGDPLLQHLADAVKADHSTTNSIRYTQETLAKEFDSIFHDEIMALWTAGTAEYAHTGHSPFANFERGAKEMGIDRKQVLWVYAMKHKDGIAAALKGHTSQREDIRGRINDLIVYLLLLRGIFNEEYGNTGNFGLGDLEQC